MTWIDRLSPSERRALVDAGRISADGGPPSAAPAYVPRPSAHVATVRLLEIAAHGVKIGWERPGAEPDSLWITPGHGVKITVSADGNLLNFSMVPV